MIARQKNGPISLEHDGGVTGQAVQKLAPKWQAGAWRRRQKTRRGESARLGQLRRAESVHRMKNIERQD